MILTVKGETMTERQYLPLDKVEPNKFNPNVMAPEEFESLKTDMKQTGPRSPLGINPIVVSPKTVFYSDPEADADMFVIIDGENRWTAAKEIGWTVIPYERRDVAEAVAKAMNYRRNKERGNMDPLKEAALFKSELGQRLNQDAIAKKYNISRSYVANRLQLLKLDEQVVEIYRKPKEVFKAKILEKHEEEVASYEKTKDEDGMQWRNEPEELEEKDFVPSGTLSVSHLEAIGSLPAKAQREIAVEVLDRDLTVNATERLASQKNKEIARAQRFKQALAQAKRKKCPSCGANPEDFSYNNEKEFKCGKCYERWDFMLSKKEADAEKQKEKSEYDKKASKELTEKFKEARENPSYIRTPETPEELHKKTQPWILRKVLELTEVSKIQIEGKRGDEVVKIDYTPPGSYTRMDLTFTVGKKTFGFNVEKKDYKKIPDKARVNLGWRQKPSDETRKEMRRFFSEVVEGNEDPKAVPID